jgi:hypothetical protein
MSATNPFAYNTGSTIGGTTQVGSLAVGTTDQNYSGNLGGVPWWMGPDEELGYVIAHPVPSNTQPTPITANRIYLSPTYKGTDIQLSNNNQTASQLFGYQQSVLGVNPIGTTDKVMFSILCTLANPGAAPDSHFVGVGYTTMNYSGNPYGGFPGNDNQSMGYGSAGDIWYNGSVYQGGFETWGNNDIIDIVIDNNTNNLWVRVNGGNWNNNPSANPATGSNGIETIGGPFYPVLCPAYEGTMIIQNSPVYSVPSGYNFLATLASVGFYRTNDFLDSSFINLSEYVTRKYSTPQTFSSATEASIWLTNNGFWNSYITPVLYLDAGNPLSYPGSGTTWIDLIGGKTFNLINGPTYNSGNGGRIQFTPSSGQYAQCSTSLPSLNTWSVGVWHYYTGQNTGTSPNIVSEIFTGGFINYILGNGSDTSPNLQTGFWMAPGWILTENGYTLAANNWYYIVGTYDGNTLSLYVNNTLVESTSGLVYTPQSSNSGIFLMSRWDNQPSELWGGYLSTVGIYDKSLTSTQISSIWNSEKSRYGL